MKIEKVNGSTCVLSVTADLFEFDGINEVLKEVMNYSGLFDVSKLKNFQQTLEKFFDDMRE